MGSCCSNVLRAILFIDCIFIVLRLLHNLCFQSFDLLSLISGLGPLSYILSSIVLIFISLLGAYGVIVESSRHLKQVSSSRRAMFGGESSRCSSPTDQ